MHFFSTRRVVLISRSADLIDYTAEEGLRALGQGELLNSDSFPGQTRNKLCLVSKVGQAMQFFSEQGQQRARHSLDCCVTCTVPMP